MADQGSVSDEQRHNEQLVQSLLDHAQDPGHCEGFRAQCVAEADRLVREQGQR